VPGRCVPLIEKEQKGISVAGASLLALIDDIAAILDDVALMTKVAAKKTVGVLGDDLALNAQQVAGVRADRELPVVWAVAKGSLANKAILVPVALLISAFLPWAVVPLLMLGGLYLCFEGAEKWARKFLHKADESAAHEPDAPQESAGSDIDLAVAEKEKIKGAIRTDFVLSTEIIVIALGVVANEAMTTRVAVLIGVALLITVGVYGLVAAIVKLDDLGLYLHGRESALAQAAGKALLRAAPMLMKFLAIVGAAAMFLVGGGILAHGIPAVHHVFVALAAVPGGFLLLALRDMAVGLVAGALALWGMQLARRIRRAVA
jgi:predicted DNA repair protein MutK